jgi:NADH:ubiquinone oxidoreductase subunit 4 (subunit M)
MVQRALFGPTIARFENVRDATPMEMVPMFVLVAAVMVVGVYPAVIADVFTEGVSPIVDAIQRSAFLAVR